MNTSINGHLENLKMYGGVTYIQGHVDDLWLYGGVVYNSGHIDYQHNIGGGQPEPPREKIVYRDRVVEKEVEVVKYRDRLVEKEKIVYRDSPDTAEVRERLDAALEVNHQQAKRIRELERIISQHRESKTKDPWDIKPTPAECEQLLRQFDIFTEQ